MCPRQRPQCWEGTSEEPRLHGAVGEGCGETWLRRGLEQRRATWVCVETLDAQAGEEVWTPVARLWLGLLSGHVGVGHDRPEQSQV